MPKTPEKKDQGPDKLPDFKKILVAVDGSKNAERAAEIAAELAKKFDSELIVLHVALGPPYSYSAMFPTLIPPPQDAYDQYMAHAREVEKACVDRAVSLAEERGVKARGMVESGVSSVVEAITTHAGDLNTDLLVVGTRGLGGFKKLLLGSVSSGVVAHANCPVLVVR